MPSLNANDAPYWAERAKRAEAERDEAVRRARKAEITLRDRTLEHLAHDNPQVLRTLGHWPDCKCGACYAIHCLDIALSERDAAQHLFAQQERHRDELLERHRDELLAERDAALKLERIWCAAFNEGSAERDALRAENAVLRALLREAQAWVGEYDDDRTPDSPYCRIDAALAGEKP